MDFKEYLDRSNEEISAELKRFIEKMDRWMEVELPASLKIGKLLGESVMGGKMLRGTLVKLGYTLANGSKMREITKPSLAFEILHGSLLIHDDIMDRSLLRRGKPSLYQSFGGDHLGMSKAMCFGDLGFFLAVGLIAESDFDPIRKNLALGIFSRNVSRTVLGQMMDVEMSGLETLNEVDVLEQYKLKTASYSFVGPMSVGAVLGGASGRLLEQIKHFGESLGIAFQIRDDYLGVFGESSIFGKSVVNDIEEGKQTLIYIYAHNHADSGQKSILDRIYGKRKVSKHDLESVKKIFVDTGAVDYSREKVDSYSAKARSLIPLLTEDRSKRELLEGLAEFLVNRQS